MANLEKMSEEALAEKRAKLDDKITELRAEKASIGQELARRDAERVYHAENQAIGIEGSIDDGVMGSIGG